MHAYSYTARYQPGPLLGTFVGTLGQVLGLAQVMPGASQHVTVGALPCSTQHMQAT